MILYLLDINILWWYLSSSTFLWVPMPRTTNLRNLKEKVIISERQLTSKYKMLEWRLTVWPFMSVRSFITSSSAEGGRHHTGDREHYHKDNLRHLPRFPGFFVTFRILVSVRPPVGCLVSHFTPEGRSFLLSTASNLRLRLRNEREWMEGRQEAVRLGDYKGFTRIQETNGLEGRD